MITSLIIIGLAKLFSGMGLFANVSQLAGGHRHGAVKDRKRRNGMTTTAYAE